MFDWINMQQNITVFYLIQRPKLFWFGVSQPLEKTHWKYDPKDFWPFRRLFILMRRQDLTIKKILTTTTTTLETCDIWDTDYNFYKWEPEFVTIFVTWQSRVTLDSIRNSCDVLKRKHMQYQKFANSHMHNILQIVHKKHTLFTITILHCSVCKNFFFFTISFFAQKMVWNCVG